MNGFQEISENNCKTETILYWLAYGLIWSTITKVGIGY